MQNIKEQLSKFDHNEIYLERYVKFIKYCLIFNFGKILKIEKHHILPQSKYLFPEFSDLKLFPWNRIDLTPRQHYIAHWILSKVYIQKTQKSSCLKAFHRMSSESHTCVRNITSVQFDRAREANRTSMTINNPMHIEEVVERAKLSMRNYYTQEIRNMISEKRKGICNITESGKKSLSDFAKLNGLGKYKGPNQLHNFRISISKGKWLTPFGEFYNPTEASVSNLNIENISRYRIKKQCLEKINGFEFITRTES